jgi:hypothetical protein
MLSSLFTRFSEEFPPLFDITVGCQGPLLNAGFNAHLDKLNNALGFEGLENFFRELKPVDIPIQSPSMYITD